MNDKDRLTMIRGIALKALDGGREEMEAALYAIIPVCESPCVGKHAGALIPLSAKEPQNKICTACNKIIEAT